jgi:hypothetical protein
MIDIATFLAHIGDMGEGGGEGGAGGEGYGVSMHSHPAADKRMSSW